MDKLETKVEAEFTYEDLLKIINFDIDNKINKIESYGYNFTFEKEGKLNKEMPEKTNEIELELVEVDYKAKCLFKVGKIKNANISCDLNLENHPDIQSFSFKISSIMIEDYEIHLGKIENIELIHIEENSSNNNDYTTYLIKNDNILNLDNYNNNSYKNENNFDNSTSNNDKGKDNDKQKENNENKHSDNDDDNNKDTESVNFNDNGLNNTKNDYYKVGIIILLVLVFVIIIIFGILFFNKCKKLCVKVPNEQKHYSNTSDENYPKYNSDMSDQRMKKKKNKNHKIVNN